VAKILIVDDEPAMCDLIAGIVRAEGHEAVSATHASSAVSRLDAGEEFDLAILDVVMPTMSGDDLAREIRRRDPDAKVLFVTGHNDALFAARNFLWQGESFLDKPFTPAGLVEAVCLALYGTLHRPDVAESGL
jgi:CheY-like chemotaxis protein